MDSNHRPSGYEPDELPLLHPAAGRKGGGTEALAPAYCPTRVSGQYRRRWGVSRPCSGRERVGPPRACHQGQRASTSGPEERRGRQGVGPVREWRATRPLGPLGCTRCHASTGGPSTSSSCWGLTHSRWGGTHLGACFALRCCQRLSRPDDGYPAVLLAEQPVHRRSVRPGPLVLGAGLRSPPTPATDRDRTVSRRSEPSSRAALMGEQPNPWDLLRPQDATSRHRCAKPCRRCGLSGKISLLSPG